MALSDLFSFCSSSFNFISLFNLVQGLVTCASVCERNLLADTAKIVEKNNKICKRKDDSCRKIVTDGLLAMGYDASVCKSRWEKSPNYLAGNFSL